MNKILIHLILFCLSTLAIGQNSSTNYKLIQTLTGHTKKVYSAKFSPDGSKIVSGSGDNSVKIWNASNGKLLQTLTGHTKEVYSAKFSPDGNRIISGGEDNSLKIWNANNGKLLQTLSHHDGRVNCVNFSPDGNKIVSGSADNSIKVWNVNNGKLLQTLTGHTFWVSSVNFSPDGTRIVSGSWDNNIKIWNINNGKLLQTLTGHTSYVISVNFSPDGNRIVSGSEDNSIKIWNANNGDLLQTLTGHMRGVSSVNFSPDGTRIVSGSWDNNIKIWNVSNGKLLQTFTGNIDVVRSVDFSPDGNKIVSGSYDNSVKIWGNTNSLPKTVEIIKPVFSWLNPNSSTTSATFSIKFAISHPNKPITNVRLVQNGIVITTRDFEIVKNTNTSTYSKSITKEIVLEEGANAIKAIFEVDGTEYTSSSRTITKLTENPPSVVTNPDENKNEKRVALIIGNAAYKKGALKNPVNDANTMKSTLQSLGFRVFKYTDCDQRQLKTAIRDFGSKLDEETVALAFYAGHGVEVNGRNYLIPTDATLDKEADVDLDCVPMDNIIDQMEGANTKNNILILDACRNNPFARSWGRSTASRGIKALGPSTDITVLYATVPGTTASDGDNKNGLFTECFNKNLDIPNLSLMDIIIRTKDDVVKRSRGKQTPYMEGTPFYFIFNKQ